VINVVAFSGGKDSTAVILWAREQGIEYRTVFCDTGFEHQLTLDYIREIDQKLSLGVEWLRSTAYPGGFEELCIKKQMFPKPKGGRFCTKELKIEPLWAWIEAQDDDVTMYQGIRAEESTPRAKMNEREFVEEAGGYWIERPIFRWTADQVFEMHRRHGIEPNPLYLCGMKRVGCAPCIFASKPELRQWALRFPEVRERVVRLEAELNRDAKAPRTFFRAAYLPERFKKELGERNGVRLCSATEVFDYVTEIDRVQLDLLNEEPTKCLSVYNLCE